MGNKQGQASPSSALAGTGIYTSSAVAFTTSLFENTSDLLAAVDCDRRLVAINAPFRREFELIFGRPIELGQRLDEVLGYVTNDRNKASDFCSRALSGEAFSIIEDFGDQGLLRKYYEFSFTPIFDTRHEVILAAIVVRDLSMASGSERRFGPLLEAAPDATIIVRPDGVIDLANGKAERMFGYERHQMNGIRVEQLVPEGSRARHIAQRNAFSLRPAARPMSEMDIKLLGVRADGSEFPVEISLNPLDVDGVQLVVAAVRDMTLRQHAEDTLRAYSADLERRVAKRTAELESATKAFRATFEQASVGIAHVDVHGNWLRVNDQLCDIVGYTRDELITLTFQHITHPDDLDADLRKMYQLLAGEISSYTMDKRYVRKSRDIVWINLNVSLVRDRSGLPEYFISVVKNITDRKIAEEELRRNKETLELAIAATGLGMFDADPKTDSSMWNDELRSHFGLGKNVIITLERFIDWLHPEDRDRVRSLLESTLRLESGGYFHTEYRALGVEDKQERWIEARGKMFFDEAGAPVRFIGTTLDITEKKKAEEALRSRERQLRLMFEANPIGTGRGKVSGEITDANPAYLRILGRTKKELLEGRIRWQDMTPSEYAKTDAMMVRQTLRHGISGLFEKEYIRPDGTRVPVMLACAMLEPGSDEMVAFVLDLSERKEAEERIRQAALHDPLTGLPNRALLFDYAKHVFGRVRRSKLHAAVLFIDLDRFKSINDSHGHEIGDAVLKEVAQRIDRCTRADDMAFRLGGDEFLVLLPEVDDDTNAGDVARHVAQCLNRPYLAGAQRVLLSASIGISIFPRDGNDIDTLINNADAAIYQAKQFGRNNVQFYSEELAARSQRQLRIEKHLKSALTENSFQLLYQPLVDMKSSYVVGVEALVRWHHSDIGPDQFVPVAEATGQIGQLSEWVIGEACRQHNVWRSHGLPAIPIAINVSAVQLRRADFAEHFLSQLRERAIESTALQVEVTETALMENLDHGIEVLSRLKAIGVKIALDDFGTGYSSLNYLSRLPLNKIKVDKSFVQRLEHDDSSRAITEAVIALGRTLNLEVVAEGIESDVVLRYLQQHGCTQAQGFHVCRPITGDAFETWFGKHEITVRE